mmetsp:Transcript_99549/g.249577  ORF Transcript_99549/g.249577 Transcript_99549/m.249577 type:complete len:263 (-) Transcript_99549:916-1704(-)
MELHASDVPSEGEEGPRILIRPGTRGSNAPPDLEGWCRAVAQEKDASTCNNSKGTPCDEVGEHNREERKPYQQVLTKTDLLPGMYQPIKHDVDSEEGHDATNEKAWKELQNVNRQQEEDCFSKTQYNTGHLGRYFLPLGENCRGEDVASCETTGQTTCHIGDADHAHLSVGVQRRWLLCLDSSNIEDTAEGNNEEETHDVHDLRRQHVPSNVAKAIVQLEGLPACVGMRLWLRNPVSITGCIKRHTGNQKDNKEQKRHRDEH